jgi:hypothetical protein
LFDDDDWTDKLEYEPEEQNLTKYNKHYLVLHRLKIVYYNEINELFFLIKGLNNIQQLIYDCMFHIIIIFV